eukprot:8599644-Lingulodinium_polyedra.AAC.1
MAEPEGAAVGAALGRPANGDIELSRAALRQGKPVLLNAHNGQIGSRELLLQQSSLADLLEGLDVGRGQVDARGASGRGPPGLGPRHGRRDGRFLEPRGEELGDHQGLAKRGVTGQRRELSAEAFARIEQESPSERGPPAVRRREGLEGPLKAAHADARLRPRRALRE